jgi:hypothetical protein
MMSVIHLVFRVFHLIVERSTGRGLRAPQDIVLDWPIGIRR